MFRAADNEMPLPVALDSNNFQQRLLLPFSNPFYCPFRVLGNQWLRICCRAFERGKIGSIAHVAQRDTHIAQKTATLDPADWRIFKQLPEILRVQVQVFP